MWQRRSLFVQFWVVFLLISVRCPMAQADWQETFNDGTFDLSTWQFLSYPQMTGTFTGALQAGPDGNDYLAIEETSSVEVGGAAFGLAIGAPEEFTDVRLGAVVNAAGLAAHSYVGLGARATYFMDDGSISGYPGIVASTYLMLIHYQEGPANLRIEVFKTANLSEGIMKTYHEVLVPGVAHARSYYAELDVVGSDPVYITGSLYAHKDGSLLARTPTLIDTHAKDAWENSGFHDGVYPKGVSVVFSMNEGTDPVGFRATFDNVSSVAISPADAHVKDVAVEAFQGYQDSAETAAAWVCNIPGYDYVSLNKDGDDGRMLFQYQNQFDPFFTEAVRTFEIPVDWTVGGTGTLSLAYRGQTSNVPQPMSILLEDAAGKVATVTHPVLYAVQTKFWRQWDIDLNTLDGIDLTAVKTMTLRVGDGTDSGQSKDGKDRDEILINNLVVNPPQ